MRVLALFFPWVNDTRDASADVPFVGDLWTAGARSWREALCARVQRHGFPTEDRAYEKKLFTNVVNSPDC